MTHNTYRNLKSLRIGEKKHFTSAEAISQFNISEQLVRSGSKLSTNVASHF